MFALLRFGQTCGALGDAAAAEKYLTQAEQLIQAVHPFCIQHDRRGEPVGVYWKVSVSLGLVNDISISIGAGSLFLGVRRVMALYLNRH